MDVTPVLMGDRADIKIVPRISYLGGPGEKTVVRCTRAQTEVTVPFGQWTTIAGVNVGANEAMNAILESGSRSGDSSLSISLMVEKY